MREVLSRLDGFCGNFGLKRPSRATVYKLMAVAPGHTYQMKSLPHSVQEALYNLSSAAKVPGHQLAFHCFNCGSSDAVSFAAGLPWLDIHQTLRMRGWRPKSRGLALAAARARRIH